MWDAPAKFGNIRASHTVQNLDRRCIHVFHGTVTDYLVLARERTLDWAHAGLHFEKHSESLRTFLTTLNPLLPEKVLIGFRASGKPPCCSHGCPAGPLLALASDLQCIQPNERPTRRLFRALHVVKTVSSALFSVAQRGRDIRGIDMWTLIQRRSQQSNRARLCPRPGVKFASCRSVLRRAIR